MGTRAVRTQFNDQNRKASEHYVSIDTCAFVVDFEIRSGYSLRDRYDLQRSWKLLDEIDIVDRMNSPAFTRMFYVPFLNRVRNHFGTYVLYQVT